MCNFNSFRSRMQTATGNMQFQPVSLAQLLPESMPVLNITTVLEHAQAKICKIEKNFGYIQYKLDPMVLKKSIERNGAPTLPENNGKIFFHYSEVSGPMSDLKEGNYVDFKLVHLKTNNKIIAHRVQKSDPEPRPEDRYAMQLAHVLRTQVPTTRLQNEAKTEQPKICYVEKTVFGKVSEIKRINNGTGHAFLKAEKYPGEQILMPLNQIIGSDISILKKGDAFTFKLFKNNHNGRYIARNCQYIEPQQEPQPKMHKSVLAHHQFMELPKFTLTIEEPKFSCKSKNVRGIVVAVNTAQKYGFLISDEACKLGQQQIFFHENDMIGIIANEVKPKETLYFDLFFNNDNKKYIAKNISRPEVLSEGLQQARSFLLDTTSTTSSKLPRPAGKNANSVAAKISNKATLGVVPKLVCDERRRSIETLTKASNR